MVGQSAEFSWSQYISSKARDRSRDVWCQARCPRESNSSAHWCRWTFEWDRRAGCCTVSQSGQPTCWHWSLWMVPGKHRSTTWCQAVLDTFVIDRRVLAWQSSLYWRRFERCCATYCVLLQESHGRLFPGTRRTTLSILSRSIAMQDHYKLTLRSLCLLRSTRQSARSCRPGLRYHISLPSSRHTQRSCKLHKACQSLSSHLPYSASFQIPHKPAYGT